MANLLYPRQVRSSTYEPEFQIVNSGLCDSEYSSGRFVGGQGALSLSVCLVCSLVRLKARPV